jgi:hypothetical protein
MDDKFRSILVNSPEKSPRSRSKPNQDLANELRRHGMPYTDIERILVEQCHLHTSRSAINDFVRVRLRRKNQQEITIVESLSRK